MATRFAHIPTVGAADHGNDGKPLARAMGGLAVLGLRAWASRRLRRYGPSVGCGRGSAGEEEIRLALEVRARLQIAMLLRARGGTGYGCLGARFSQGSNRP